MRSLGVAQGRFSFGKRIALAKCAARSAVSSAALGGKNCKFLKSLFYPNALCVILKTVLLRLLPGKRKEIVRWKTALLSASAARSIPLSPRRPPLICRRSALTGAKVGRTDAAVLAAANIADELFKEREASEALRRQLKQYIDDAAQAKNEVSELKRELFKLQNRK